MNLIQDSQKEGYFRLLFIDVLTHNVLIARDITQLKFEEFALHAQQDMKHINKAVEEAVAMENKINMKNVMTQMSILMTDALRPA